VDGRDRLVAFNDGDTHRLAGGDGAVLIVDPAIKALILGFEAAFVFAAARTAVVAAARAGEGTFESGEQKDRQVGIEAAAHRLVHAEDDLRAELASAALVSFRGVGVAVAEDDAAGVERGSDDLRDALRAVGEHEAELGHGIQRFGARIEKKSADAVADPRAARLAGDSDGVALGFERRRQLANLRGFAGAVEPLKGQEESPGHESRVQQGRV